MAKRLGRPPRGAPLREARIQIALTREQYAALAEEAARADYASLAAFVRERKLRIDRAVR